VLEPMNSPSPQRVVGGFTMIELMVVVALAGILLALAAPSFFGTLARKRMEGAAEIFGTDLQYARSEAVARNTEVRLATGAGGACYTVYVWRGAGSCTCGPAISCMAPAVVGDEIKTVNLQGTGATLTANVIYGFEPVRGMIADASSPAVTFSSSGGTWQLTTTVTAVGRASTCSPSGSLKGYPAC
jgi:type IV fimbrial biogenesis protein FimT